MNSIGCGCQQLWRLGRLETDNNVKQSAKLKRINSAIHRQLNQFGKTLTKNILPDLIANGVNLLINQQFPKAIKKEIEEYLFSGSCRLHPYH